MSHVPTEVQDNVKAEVQRCLEIAKEMYPLLFHGMFPNIVYNKRGRTAGTACSATYTINLNSVLLMENLDTFIDGRTGRGTVTHEFAHLVDAIVNPHTRRGGYYGPKRSIHGPTWKRIMRQFGATTPSRCHSYDTTNSRISTKAKHIYTCNSCGSKMSLGPKRHRKQQRGLFGSKTVYWMRGCSHAKQTGYTYDGFKSTPKPFRDRYPTPKVKAPKIGTKIDHAIQIFRSMPNQDNSFIITRIMNECDMSYAGATTYFYRARKVVL